MKYTHTQHYNWISSNTHDMYTCLIYYTMFSDYGLKLQQVWHVNVIFRFFIFYFHFLNLNLIQNDIEDGEESVHNFPCIASPIVYSPPPATSIASIVGEFGSKSQLRRSRSSVLRKSYTSDDELDELKCPLSPILLSGSLSSVVSAKRSLKSKEIRSESPVRYELLRDVWMNSE